MKLPFDIDSTTAFVVALSSAVAAIEQFFKPVRNAYRMIKSYLQKRKENSVPTQLKKLTETVTGLVTSVEQIEYQVKHNSGFSMRDDISTIKLEVRELAAAHAVNQELTDEGMFRCDAEGRNYLVNTAYANLLGVTREQLLDLDWMQWVDDPEYDHKWQPALRKGHSTRIPTTLRDIDGNKIKVKIKIVKYLDGYEGRITHAE